MKTSELIIQRHEYAQAISDFSVGTPRATPQCSESPISTSAGDADMDDSASTITAPTTPGAHCSGK
jgi:hypothetical protein